MARKDIMFVLSYEYLVIIAIKIKTKIFYSQETVEKRAKKQWTLYH